jgi:hypothetical protein
MILKYVTRGNGEKYKNSMREYIIDRAQETGIIPEIDTAMKISKDIRNMIEEFDGYYTYKEEERGS